MLAVWLLAAPFFCGVGKAGEEDAREGAEAQREDGEGREEEEEEGIWKAGSLEGKRRGRWGW